MKFPKFLTVAVISSNTAYQHLATMELKFLELLSEALHFRFRTVHSPDGEGIRQRDNGSWTGTFGVVHRGQADLALAFIGLSHQRVQTLNHSYPYTAAQATFATPKATEQHNAAALLDPFSVSSWICLLSLLVVVPLTFRVCLHRSRRSLSSLALKTVGSLLRQLLDLPVSRPDDRLLCSNWLLCSQALSFCYTAVLLSYLTIPVKGPSVKTIEELAAAVGSGRYMCLTIAGTSTHVFLSSTDVRTIRTIAGAMERHGWFLSSSSPDAKRIFDSAKQPNTAVIATRILLQVETDERVTLVSPDSFYTGYSAMALRKDFCCRKTLDSMVQRIVAAGLYQRVVDVVIETTRRNAKSELAVESQDPDRPLSLTDLATIFYLLLSGWVLATFVFIIEILKGNKPVLKRRKPSVYCCRS